MLTTNCNNFECVPIMSIDMCPQLSTTLKIYAFLAKILPLLHIIPSFYLVPKSTLLIGLNRGAKSSFHLKTSDEKQKEQL